MTTDANALLNLQTAIRNVRSRMGLSDVPADWTYEQRTAYNKALAAEIQSYAQSFTPAILATAATVSGKNYGTLEDSSFAWGDFAGETLSNAPAVLGTFTNKLLIAGVIIAAVYFGVRAYRQGGQTA